MAEWLIAADFKSAKRLQRFLGSNPSTTALPKASVFCWGFLIVKITQREFISCIFANFFRLGECAYYGK